MIPSLKTKACDFTKRFVIALDGPSAVGKGAVGNELAKKLCLEYFGSGSVYRAFAKICLEHNLNLADEQKICEFSNLPSAIKYAKGYDLNDEEIAAAASKIATYTGVRKNLSAHLVETIKNTPRIIMEGRDIGTVIAPDADLKLFLTASRKVRAERRYKQLKEEGKECILPEIFEQLKLRDQRDAERDAAPMVPAPEAVVIDTSDLTLTEVIDRVMESIGL